ncbi:MAG: tRNA (N6-isopentenyl adenosine(37)-C2)-methylthiotransferase MiaB [Bacteroidetes bacterium]|nr:MAG: tRNA (N6-isopentenyl adenosine(37)-C2)-methylthiotransferase MiaB [Bacteroidota bacterium]MBL1145716.1 tRNA (N6-isopentenyl adenosine(37)-C2)-methylthiotransferase MiaB [Bacteroidota bacterium]NOG58510.1 tRNA (N6-isopentenyl adenosine(37)-C2)-methylthiotransferase MiaB [Bacteroidota bacterium]
MKLDIKEKEIIEERQGETLDRPATNQKKTARKFYIESYGCQMNFSDSEIVASILESEGYQTTKLMHEADMVFVNTCSIREKAEQTVRKRLSVINKSKKANPGMIVGVLGCMAERMKAKLLEEEKLVDIVVGPDAYRDLPNLVGEVDGGRKAVNVILSKEETYGDISPVRLGGNGVTAFVSITRGCDNMCTFCVVPFTRGRERSRNPESIINEVSDLAKKGYKEITLLGQNVDSYLWHGGGLKKEFDLLSDAEKEASCNFAQLMEKVALVDSKVRIRFSTSHPKDMSDEVLHVMAKYDNICKYIHLPFQSGNSRILEMMNRGYTREWYINRIDAIKRIMPDCAISADIISGFCTETEEEHRETLSLMEYVQYHFSYMFKYSERPNTLAQRKFEDDIPEETKQRRLAEIIELQQVHSHNQLKKDIGKTYEVLVEGVSKKSDDELYGRNTHNSVVVFPRKNYKAGDYVNVFINECTSATLKGEAI